MSELLISLLRFGYLVALWLLVLAAVAVLRQDIFGTRVVRRGLPERPDSLRGRVAERIGLVRGRSEQPAQPVRGGSGRVRRSVVGGGAGAAAGATAAAAAGASGRRSPGPASRTLRPQRAPRSAAPTRLVVIDGPLAGTTLPLSTASILAGRAPSSTLVLDDDFASSRHARFFPQGESWFVEDLGSTNGTTVGGTRVGATPMEVPVGTPVQIGRTTVEFRR